MYVCKYCHSPILNPKGPHTHTVTSFDHSPSIERRAFMRFETMYIVYSVTTDEQDTHKKLTLLRVISRDELGPACVLHNVAA